VALFHHQDFVRALPGGAGESGATVTFKLEADDSTITTATTDADGFFQKSLSATATTGANSYLLHPGPYYTEVTIGSYTRRHSSRSLGTAGPLHIPAQLFLNRAMGTGIVSSPGSSLNTWAVTADGSARSVVVATGAAVVQGIPFWNAAARTVLITANASGNPRIDTIVLEVVPQGEATEGKVTLKVVDGTAAASPVAPTLTQSTALWQFPLADVAVANGAATISQGNITDRRDYVERSTTTVEDDVVALEARVDDLEDGTVPRMDIVATYSATVNPGAIAHGIWSNIAQVNDSSFTFHNGYTEIDATTMVAQAWHSGCAAVQLLVYNSLYSALGTESVMVTAINGTGVSQDPASGTLYIVVTKLVTS
jgi:hypothetical protein